MSKKEKKQQEPETQEPELTETPETDEAAQEAAPEVTVEEAPQINWEEKYNAEHDTYLRLAAEFDNFRKRNASVRAEAYADGQRNVAGAMLGVLDNLERALESAMEDSPLKSGVDLTLKQMRDAYTKLGVTEINRVGEKFDPNLENAVMQGTADEGAPGTVCQVLQKGYSMNGTVIRHAMVKVVADN